MKTINDVRKRLRLELKTWAKRQSQNTFERFYLYYLPTKAEHDGGLLICNNNPKNSEYKLAKAEHVRRDLTIDQNFNILMNTVKHLPIMS